MDILDLKNRRDKMNVLSWILDILKQIFEFLFGEQIEVPTELTTEDAVCEWLEELLGFTMDGEDEEFWTSIPYIKEMN